MTVNSPKLTLDTDSPAYLDVVTSLMKRKKQRKSSYMEKISEMISDLISRDPIFLPRLMHPEARILELFENQAIMFNWSNMHRFDFRALEGTFSVPRMMWSFPWGARVYLFLDESYNFPKLCGMQFSFWEAQGYVSPQLRERAMLQTRILL